MAYAPPRASLLPPQGILCIKIDALLLCCFVVLLYYCKTQFSKLCVSQGNIPKNARIMIILMLYSSTTMSNYEPWTSPGVEQLCAIRV